MAQKQVFISYSHVDIAMVNRLKRDLYAKNIAYWVDHDSLTPGTQIWSDTIERAIPKSLALIYIASPSSKQSKYVLHELAIADRYNIPIKPYWIQGQHWLDAAPFGMALTQHIDARTNYPGALAQLYTSLGVAPEEATTSPQKNTNGGMTGIILGVALIIASIIAGVYTEFSAAKSIEGIVGSISGIVLGGIILSLFIARQRRKSDDAQVATSAPPPSALPSEEPQEPLSDELYDGLMREIDRTPSNPDNPEPRPPESLDDADILDGIQRFLDS